MLLGLLGTCDVGHGSKRHKLALLHIPFEAINEEHLQRLIDTQASETLYIDYKQHTYGTNDDARAEFLADVSSFANTAGGDVVIGVAENNGVPVSFSPLTGDPDAEQRRLESMALAGLEPRIPALQTKSVRLAQGGYVLLVRVPRSHNPPHRIIFKGKNCFRARSSVRKYEPNVEELRRMFDAGPQLSERIRKLRMERISAILAGETPVPRRPVAMEHRCQLALHVVPFSAFDTATAPVAGSARQPAWRARVSGC